MSTMLHDDDQKSAVTAFSIHTEKTGGKKAGDHDLSTIHIPEKPLTVTLSSIIGPSDPEKRRVYYFSLLLMIFCGSSTDFIGKLVYQLLPGGDKNDGSAIASLKHDIWATWCLTAGSFFVCSFALISGRESFYSPNFTLKSFFKICVPAMMDVIVTGGRYLGLIFLPAAVVSILKNGLQLVFIAIIRWFRGKYFGKTQWFGLGLVCIGLIIVSLEDLFADSNSTDNTGSSESEGSWFCRSC